MAGPISATTQTAHLLGAGTAAASHLGADVVAAHRLGAAVDAPALARDLMARAANDPGEARALAAQLKPHLTPVEQGQLAAAIDKQAPAAAAGLSAAQKALMLDLTQMGIDVVGLFDPTPVSGAINTGISAARGDVWGTLLSAASMIPYAGDLARAGKLGKYAKVVVEVAEMAAKDSRFAKEVRPALEALDAGLKAIPAKVFDMLPKGARASLETMKATIGKALEFRISVRGTTIGLDGIKLRDINYVKRDRASYDALRSAFDGKIRKEFVQSLAADPAKVAALKTAGLDETAIARLAEGKVPSGWQVHHKLPIDDGGTNARDNLVLIKNDPSHIGITNAQRALTGNLKPGESARVEWPIVPGFVYPPVK